MKTQKERVLLLLQKRRKSGVGAYEFAMVHGILRYGGCIFNLRNEGYEISMTEKRVKKNGSIQRQTTYFLN